MRSMPRLAFALLCVWGAHPAIDRVLGHMGPSRYGPADAIASAFLLAPPALLLVVAAIASARSDSGLALAAGLAAACGLPVAPFALVAMATAVALGRPWSWAVVRERVPMTGVGMLLGLCIHGLANDLAASVAPAAHDRMHWWYPDPVGERIVRATLELGMLGAGVAFARGRTWGALALGLLALGLAWCCVSFRGPMHGGGCVGYAHTFGDTTPMVALVPALLAVGPWAAPLARALRRLGTDEAERRA